MARPPHHRIAAQARDLVEEDLARLHVGDHRGAGPRRQDVARQQRQQQIGPDDAAPVVDHADAVAVAVERDPDVARPLLDAPPQLREIRRHRRVRVVRGKRPVDVAVDHVVAPRQPAHERPHDVARRAVARIPDDLQPPPPPAGRGQRFDVGVEHVGVPDSPAGGRGRARRREVAESLDPVAVERTARVHELEPVVLGRVVRPGDHDARVRPQMVDREIEHGRGSAADARDRRAGRRHPLGQRRLERRRREPAVESEADRRRGAPVGGDRRGERAADRQRVVGVQRLADDAANVVFANDGRMERAARDHSAAPAPPVPRPPGGVCGRPIEW